ncbi:protein tyrosine phosphatase family protein [Acinetobacter sp. SA01]|uniref:protein tyrosine phosphatase family protein n=1 Tax=Acinetobacter sp. SA01 TaxID=1862567 RepID=UPI00140D4D9C|nr:protein tyrosine phosphatase family protein [Acinetobacter sp. SA01]
MNEIEHALSHIKNFQFIHEHLFTSAQPKAEQLKLIKEYGVTTIVNLALSDAEPHLDHEDKVCLDLGLNYIKLPISAETPSDDQCLLVLDLLNHLVQEQMVWVHCATNHHVSCLMYLYRQYYMNVDMPTAQELMHSIWEPNETWIGLIHAVALQLQGRKATQELQQSLIHPDHFA